LEGAAKRRSLGLLFPPGQDNMTNIDFGTLQIEELSSTYEQVDNFLAQRVLDERNKIEARLRQLSTVRRRRIVIPPKY
jgi:hypothetical protein